MNSIWNSLKFTLNSVTIARNSFTLDQKQFRYEDNYGDPKMNPRKGYNQSSHDSDSRAQNGKTLNGVQVGSEFQILSPRPCK